MLLKKKKRHGRPPVEVNIVSLMDVLTTLLFFILMAMTFSNFSILDASALISGTPEKEKNVFALKIIIKSKKHAVIQLGPIDGLKMIRKNWFERYLSKNYSGSPQNGYFRSVKGRNITNLLSKVQQILINIKKSFPHENKVVLAFNDKIKYQNMISSMNEMRTLPKNKKAFELTNFIGRKEKTRVLFPMVVLAENR